jgi:hypothetical protein
MNLSAKSLGRLAMLAVALFFFSCEDESSFLGFKNSNKKFDVSYVEIPLESSLLLIDSVITDNSGVGTQSIGRYIDPVLGTVQAETFLQLYPASTSKIDTDDKTNVYDSVTLQVRSNFYSYGFTGTQTLKFSVHEIEGDSLDRFLSKRYYYNNRIEYSAQALGEIEIRVNNDSLAKQQKLTTGQDTLLIRSKLDDNFGARLFNLALNDPGSTLSDLKKFIQEIKGLAIIPSEGNGILGLSPQSTLSKVIVHYHTVEAGLPLERSFNFTSSKAASPHFTNYTTDRSATELASLIEPYTDFSPTSGLRVVQSGSPVITKLDLKDLYAIDTIDNVIINSAELIISDVLSPSGLNLHSFLTLRILNDNNLFANYRVRSDLENMIPYFIFNDYSSTGDRNFYVASDLSSSKIEIPYDSEKNQYSVFMTSFILSLFRQNMNGVTDEGRIKFLGLYPLNPAIGSSVNRTVFHEANIKIRINYTMPTAATEID